MAGTPTVAGPRVTVTAVPGGRSRGDHDSDDATARAGATTARPGRDADAASRAEDDAHLGDEADSGGDAEPGGDAR